MRQLSVINTALKSLTEPRPVENTVPCTSTSSLFQSTSGIPPSSSTYSFPITVGSCFPPPTSKDKIPLHLPPRILDAIKNSSYIQLDLVFPDPDRRGRESHNLSIEGGSLVTVNYNKGPIRSGYPFWCKAWFAVLQSVLQLTPYRANEFLAYWNKITDIFILFPTKWVAISEREDGFRRMQADDKLSYPTLLDIPDGYFSFTDYAFTASPF